MFVSIVQFLSSLMYYKNGTSIYIMYSVNWLVGRTFMVLM